MNERHNTIEEEDNWEIYNARECGSQALDNETS